MRIEKVLNNNVVFVNDRGKEKVLNGKGLGFKMRPGLKVDESKIEQVFVLSDISEQTLAEQLFAQIPPAFVEAGGSIVAMIKENLNMEIKDSLFIHLTDHIFQAVKRIQEGTPIANALLWDIQRCYPKEFVLGLQILDLLEDRFDVKLPKDEAGFIALHIVNAKQNESDPEIGYKTVQLVKQVAMLVKYHFGTELVTETLSYYRFINHLRFLGERIFAKQSEAIPEDDGLYEVLAKRYPNSSACVQRIAKMLQAKFGRKLSDAEKMYLIIHIERLVQEKSRSQTSRKKGKKQEDVRETKIT